MAAKPIMSLELHYTMIQFLISVIIYIIVVITFSLHVQNVHWLFTDSSLFASANIYNNSTTQFKKINLEVKRKMARSLRKL